jgi:hypothetical protein
MREPEDVTNFSQVHRPVFLRSSEGNLRRFSLWGGWLLFCVLLKVETFERAHLSQRPIRKPNFETKQKILRLVVERVEFVEDQITIKHVIPVSDVRLRRNQRRGKM